MTISPKPAETSTPLRPIETLNRPESDFIPDPELTALFEATLELIGEQTL